MLVRLTSLLQRKERSHLVILPSFLHSQVLHFNLLFIVFYHSVPFPRKDYELVTFKFLNEFL